MLTLEENLHYKIEEIMAFTFLFLLILKFFECSYLLATPAVSTGYGA